MSAESPSPIGKRVDWLVTVILSEPQRSRRIRASWPTTAKFSAATMDPSARSGAHQVALAGYSPLCSRALILRRRRYSKILADDDADVGAGVRRWEVTDCRRRHLEHRCQGFGRRPILGQHLHLRRKIVVAFGRVDAHYVEALRGEVIGSLLSQASCPGAIQHFD